MLMEKEYSKKEEQLEKNKHGKKDWREKNQKN